MVFNGELALALAPGSWRRRQMRALLLGEIRGPAEGRSKVFMAINGAEEWFIVVDSDSTW